MQVRTNPQILSLTPGLLFYFLGYFLPLRQFRLQLRRREGNHAGKHRERGEGDRLQEVQGGRRYHLPGNFSENTQKLN